MPVERFRRERSQICDAIARLACVRQVQRMGEEIGNDELPRFDALLAVVEREFAELAQPKDVIDATHG